MDGRAEDRRVRPAKECSAISSRVIASCFGLAAFAGTGLLGLIAGKPPHRTLMDALIVTAAAFVIGHALGAIMLAAVHEHLDSYRRAHPIPDLDPPTPDGPDSVAASTA